MFFARRSASFLRYTYHGSGVNWLISAVNRRSCAFRNWARVMTAAVEDLEGKDDFNDCKSVQ